MTVNTANVQSQVTATDALVGNNTGGHGLLVESGDQVISHSTAGVTTPTAAVAIPSSSIPSRSDTVSQWMSRIETVLHANEKLLSANASNAPCQCACGGKGEGSYQQRCVELQELLAAEKIKVRDLQLKLNHANQSIARARTHTPPPTRPPGAPVVAPGVRVHRSTPVSTISDHS